EARRKRIKDVRLLVPLLAREVSRLEAGERNGVERTGSAQAGTLLQPAQSWPGAGASTLRRRHRNAKQSVASGDARQLDLHQPPSDAQEGEVAGSAGTATVEPEVPEAAEGERSRVKLPGGEGEEEGLAEEEERALLWRKHEALEQISDTVEETEDITFAKVKQWLRAVWPWISAPDGSLCYLVYSLTFVFEYNLILLPYLAGTFGYALFENPKPSLRFWKVMLLYSEVCLLVLYALAVSCYWGCWEEDDFHCTPDIWAPGLKHGSLFFMDVWPIFLSYLTTLLYWLAAGQVGEGANGLLGTVNREDMGGVAASRPVLHRTQESGPGRRVQSSRRRWNAAGGVHGWWLQLEEYTAEMEHAVVFFVRRLFLRCESIPNFVKVTLAFTSERITIADWLAVERILNAGLHNMRSANSALVRGG
ncbi:hypothetical protein CYMTET_33703, partial [Cymbomonas tetramitiformis]